MFTLRHSSSDTDPSNKILRIRTPRTEYLVVNPSDTIPDVYSSGTVSAWSGELSLGSRWIFTPVSDTERTYE